MNARIAVGTSVTRQDVADLIDHALLKPEMTPQYVADTVRTMSLHRIWSVCVRPCDVALAAQTLAVGPASPTRVCTVIGFPHGSTSTAAKVAEARQALSDGAAELDMVLNIGALRGGDLATVHTDIAAVVAEGHASGVIVKVILETALLTDEHKIAGCHVSETAGADFVKTSTGFAGGGATLADIRLMRHHCSATVQVKASGGVRDIDTALAMMAEGATRLGTSSTPELMHEATERDKDRLMVVPDHSKIPAPQALPRQTNITPHSTY